MRPARTHHANAEGAAARGGQQAVVPEEAFGVGICSRGQHLDAMRDLLDVDDEGVAMMERDNALWSFSVEVTSLPHSPCRRDRGHPLEVAIVAKVPQSDARVVGVGIACGDVVEGIYHLWVVQLTCAVSLWVLLFLIQCELITREKEGRLELAKQEQRLKLKPSSFTPAHGTAARRKFDKVKRKELLEEDRRLAQELAVTEEERRRDEQAWAAADAEAAAEAEADEQKQWLVKNHFEILQNYLH